MGGAVLDRLQRVEAALADERLRVRIAAAEQAVGLGEVARPATVIDIGV